LGPKDFHSQSLDNYRVAARADRRDYQPALAQLVGDPHLEGWLFGVFYRRT
jgi:hypothetical protein